jgi:hypothetical protein
MLSVGGTARLLAAALPGLGPLLVDPEDRELVPPPSLSSQAAGLGSHLGLLLRETGYMHLQATKPDTVLRHCSPLPQHRWVWP